MKKFYKIRLTTDDGRVLYYDETYNCFGVYHGTLYTNKRKAQAQISFARKYGTSSTGIFEVVEVL